MICTQPPLDVCKIMKNCRCHCLCCGCLGWGGEGRLHAHWRSLGWMALTIVMATVWAKKGLDKGKGEGEFKDGFVFSCCLILLFFWLFFFNVGWLISYQDQVNCWTGFSCKISFLVIQIWWLSYYSSSSSWLFIGCLLQDFSSSHPNLVITFLFGNYSVRVNCCK